MSDYPATHTSDDPFGHVGNYPVTYTQRPPEKRSRLTIFFRAFMVIPHAIVSFFYSIACLFAVMFAWFAIVFTGRYPRGLYDFVAGYVRFSARLSAYWYLVTDTFPPFGGGEHPEYPVQITIPPPKEQYDRVKTLFRLILLIPVYCINYVFSIWLFCVAIAIWFVGVFAGKTDAGLMEAMRMPMAYYVRATSYFFLLTEDWPPFEPGPA